MYMCVLRLRNIASLTVNISVHFVGENHKLDKNQVFLERVHLIQIALN